MNYGLNFWSRHDLRLYSKRGQTPMNYWRNLSRHLKTQWKIASFRSSEAFKIISGHMFLITQPVSNDSVPFSNYFLITFARYLIWVLLNMIFLKLSSPIFVLFSSLIHFLWFWDMALMLRFPVNKLFGFFFLESWDHPKKIYPVNDQLFYEWRKWPIEFGHYKNMRHGPFINLRILLKLRNLPTQWLVFRQRLTNHFNPTLSTMGKTAKFSTENAFQFWSNSLQFAKTFSIEWKGKIWTN